MVFGVIFEYNRQKNVLFRIVHIYLKYILTQNKSIPIPMPVLGSTFHQRSIPGPSSLAKAEEGNESRS